MTEQLQHIIRQARSSKNIRISYHIVFWIIVGFFYFLVFNWNSEFPEVSIILSIGLLPVAVITTCVFNYLLIPKYLDKKRYGYFLYLSFFTLLVSSWLSFLIVFYALIHILYKEASLEPAVLHPELQVISLNFIVFLAIAVKQIKRAFFIQQEKNDLEQKKLNTELKLKEAELKLLKAQIHPHFLFNTLNNLYGLTMEKSDEAPDLVLRLSDILDYILYRCNEKRVLLFDEISNLQNYIAIEKLRYSEKLSITVDFPDETDNLQIAPLLLLPFVENAFKHGVSNNPGTASVSISLKVQHTTMSFYITNSKNPLSAQTDSYSKGIGLKNVKKRLELLYPNKYDLKIDEKEDSFSVTLSLELAE
ncbi:histidine kinase [Draconibacterium sp. IB214405]|uniref:sensor histidine kinase n=1 Tax=Draconibacterium sp. IB214405 TaxID=3097352 RepID=UPI002A1051EB|nr:histidine kinase [Draconibacterium sp. IB214405]MDX8338515.1 histidine kinase [Draconibacterium sp. IB214405]